MEKKLFIFDLDGTILDTADDLTDSMNAVLKKFGMPQRTKEEIMSFTGDGIKKLTIRSADSEQKGEEIFPSFREYYFHHCEEKTKPYEGIMPLFRRIRTRGGKVAVLSNKADEAVQVLTKKYFSDAVDVAMGLKEGMRPKPYADGAEEIMRYFGIERKQVVLIGDSETDILTARNAGIMSVAVTWGFRGEEQLKRFRPDGIVHTAKEIESVTDGTI